MRRLATTLADLLPEAANRAADREAIRELGASITWAEAFDRAGRLGAALDDAGVGIGDTVGLLHRKSAEAFLAMHAVVGRGAIAVPIDPRASAAYGASVAANAGCRVLLTHDLCRTQAFDLAAAADIATVIGIAGPVHGEVTGGTRYLTADVVDAFDAPQPVTITPDQPAYLITTSGSTGRPKGICHSHASALAYVRFKLDAYDFGPDDRIADIAPNHFDISTQALWVTPAIGATNIVVNEQFQMLPASLAQLMADEWMTVWYGVPYLLTQLLERGNMAEHDLSHLRWVLFGGEPFPPRVLADVMRAIPSARFSNVYGPAEVNACTVHHLDGPPRGDDPIPIGGPVADTRVRLENGEIWVSGPTMMLGYWNRPDLDSQSIVDDGSRWYRTGDLAHHDQGGRLVFTGRVDHQVKIRGHRIELEAIESLLEDTPGVHNAVAAVVPGQGLGGRDQLIAGLVVGTDVEIDHDELRTRLGHLLPAYAVPAAFHPILSVPTTGSGKLDRRAIRGDLVTRHRGSGEGLRRGLGRGLGKGPEGR